MLSDSWKTAFKTALEDPKKNIAQKYKTWNCPASLAISEALIMYPTNFSRPLFNSQFVLSLTFILIIRHPVV